MRRAALMVAVLAFVVGAVPRAYDFEVARAGGALSERGGSTLSSQRGQPRSESAAVTSYLAAAPAPHHAPELGAALNSESTYQGQLSGGSPAPQAEPGAPPQGSIGVIAAYHPTTREARAWKPLPWWMRQALCIHRHESVDWHRAYVDWQGNRSPYSGGLQFLASTWRRAGGHGHAYQWAPREQLYRAWRIYRMYRTASRPGSWSEWGTAGMCT